MVKVLLTGGRSFVSRPRHTLTEVLGGSGFVAAHVLETLLKRG